MSTEGTEVSHSYNDVFISCFHEKSKFSFPNLLHGALQEKSIKTFNGKVGEEEVGDNSTLVEKIIEESWISIVVLSEKYYASSHHSQGLDQLDKILKCKKKMNQIVYPIYYEVDRSEDSKLKGVYEEDMAKHERIQEKWRSPLAELAKIKPRLIINTQQFQEQLDSDKVIQRIVELVYRSLFRYDVFISFRGQDTGYTFTGNLSNALRQKKINTFFINDELWKEQDVEISSSFLKAMKESRISIVVLSESYAKSTWCLNELSNIIEGKIKYNKLVWPIFYNVKASLVRRQEKHYKDALDGHMKKNGLKVPGWKQNLTKVADLTGVSLTSGYEYEHIEKIVESTVQSLSKYDVFLSFSREDTGHSFARYLYNVLCQSGFKTFMDVVGIGNGDQISDTVAKAIENSKHSIIIFSKNYAYSDWCLNEVVEILECWEKKNHMIWPIFHNVQLMDVRYQNNSYADAMSAHKTRYGIDADRVEKWKKALREVTYCGGFAKARKSKDNFVRTENETDLIKLILEHLCVPDSQLWPVEDSQIHNFMSTGGFELDIDCNATSITE